MPKRWTQPRSTVNLLEKPTLRGYSRKRMNVCASVSPIADDSIPFCGIARNGWARHVFYTMGRGSGKAKQHTNITRFVASAAQR